MTMQTAPTDALDLAAARRELLKLARTDPANFAEYVMRDEMTGKAIRLAKFHEEWHRLIDRFPRLVLWAAIEHGKSSTLVGRLLYELGRDPTLRCAIVSNTQSQAKKMLGTVAHYIERSHELHQVFPKLRKGNKWKDDALTIVRPTAAKDPSLAAYGVHGAVLGSRLDLLILDDILDWENARTETQRQGLHEWVMSTLLGRMSERGRVIVAGTPFNVDDLPHRLAEKSHWPAFRFPAVDVTGAPLWPERWSSPRIAKKREELGPYEAARQLDTIASSDAEAVLQRSWIERALANGTDVQPFSRVPNVEPDTWITIGVDLGVGLTIKHDPSAIVAVMAHEDGRRQVLAVESGRWRVDELVARIVDAHRQYAGARLVIESVAAQKFVADLVAGQVGAGKVTAYMTGSGDRSLQKLTEVLGHELSQGRWLIPSGEAGRKLAPEIDALVKEMIVYSPSRHTGDRLAALLLASYGARQGASRVEVGRVNWHLR